ncbi:hypothetical protein BCR42DRAFT_461763 [Absidia repens]|uniref:BHLH domain-containing protein n=1 Tax=Absidia repens TaxID=90262 RepID=A0A1X2IBA3_9FUNG|nr:hypothetical protein BCR42DRAFT_461763 [Absidia repens]
MTSEQSELSHQHHQHQQQHQDIYHQHQHQFQHQHHQHHQQQQQQQQHDIPHHHQRKKQRRQGSIQTLSPTGSPILSSSTHPSIPLIASSSMLTSSFTGALSSPTVQAESSSSCVTQPTMEDKLAPTSSSPTSAPSSSAGLNMTLVLSQENNQDRDSSASPSASPSTTTQTLENNNSSNSSNSNNNTTELRRQIHIQSEQKRRAQIKCGFEELRNELPTCLNKKMSKVALLHRTVQHIQHLKSTQITILAELERLVQENEQLKRFQQSVLQNQVMDSMYPIQ